MIDLPIPKNPKKTPKYQDSFDVLKEKMISASVFAQSILKNKFILQTDALDEDFRVILTQKDE
ncbi:6765_t:CDS:2 [Funneliformis geosporum]|nr:6765_t:CDS:2 [Funneliformis geosporum]